MNNYIGLAVRQYEEMQRGKRRSIRERSIRKIEKDAFKELVREYPELYDYYIRLRETDVDKIRSQSLAELNEQIEKLCVASQKIISLFKNLNYQTNEQLTAREEAKARLRFFKHIIEDCFSESEYLYSEQVVKAAGYEELLGESIYLIDCRNDNKKSASIA